MSRSLRVAAVALALATLAACASAPEAAPPSPAPAPTDATSDASADEPAVVPVAVVATTSILGDLVRQVLGEDGTVRVLMGPGVDPHTYAASAADAAAMRDADLVVANGLLLEEGLLSALAAAEDDGVDILEVAPLLDPIPFSGGHDHANADEHAHDADHGDDHDHGDEHDHGDDHDHDDEHDHGDDHNHGDDDHAAGDDVAHDDHDHGDLDPHVWFDPLRMATAADRIADALAEVRPDGDWAARAAALRAELEDLDAELTAAFATIPEARRKVVTNHDALGYLAARYDLEVIGTVIPGSSTSAEADPASFAALADLLVAEGIDVVFAETTDSDTLARQLASEAVGRGGLEVEVVTLFTGSLGPAGSGAETYVGLMRTNTTRIVAALAG